MLEDMSYDDDDAGHDADYIETKISRTFFHTKMIVRGFMEVFNNVMNFLTKKNPAESNRTG